MSTSVKTKFEVVNVECQASSGLAVFAHRLVSYMSVPTSVPEAVAAADLVMVFVMVTARLNVYVKS